jgi:hypothetical protein
VIHLAVQQLHADVDALVLGVRFDPRQKRDAIVRALSIRHAATVARKRNDVRDARRRRLVDRRVQRFLQALMILLAIAGVVNCASGACGYMVGIRPYFSATANPSGPIRSNPTQPSRAAYSRHRHIFERVLRANTPPVTHCFKRPLRTTLRRLSLQKPGGERARPAWGPNLGVAWVL